MTDEAGEFRRGWPIVLAAFIGIGGCFASLYFYTSGLFIKPLAAEFGWTRGEASLGSLAMLIGNVIGMPLAGRVIDRYGEVRVALAAGMLLSLSFAALGTLTYDLTSFLILVVLLALGSAGSNLIAYNRIIVRHFFRRRGLALGLAMTGTAVGAAGIPPFLAPFIAEHGWRPAYCGLAVLSLVLTFTAVALLWGEGRESKARPRQTVVSWRSICSHRAFFTIGSIIFLAAASVLGTTVHIVPMLTDRGMAVAAAGLVASMLGMAVLGGRVVTGYLLDRWDAGIVTAALLGLAAGGVLLLWTADPVLVVPGAILVGFGLGTEADLLAYLLGRRFPVASFGSVYGMILAVHALGGGLGGLLAGATVDWTGSYSAWLLLAAAGMVAAAVIAFVTERGIAPARD